MYLYNIHMYSAKLYIEKGSIQGLQKVGRKDLGILLLTIISEANHIFSASIWLEPNLEVAASLQSAKYFPVTFSSLG